MLPYRPEPLSLRSERYLQKWQSKINQKRKPSIDYLRAMREYQAEGKPVQIIHEIKNRAFPVVWFEMKRIYTDYQSRVQLEFGALYEIFQNCPEALTW